MKFLLDTHVWIWSQELPEKLGRRAARALLAPEHVNMVSAISTLEIARLLAVEAISLTVPLDAWIGDSLRGLEVRTAKVTHEIAAEAYRLPPEFHKDPTDRILVATARIHQLVLLTADERILQYPHARTMDARS